MPQSQDLTIQVLKGTTVHVQEVEHFSHDDKRIPSDRQVVINAPQALKLAIREVDGSNRPQPKAALLMRCG